MKVDGQLAIVLPSYIVDKLGLKEGYFVNVFELKPGVIAITTKKEVVRLLLGEQQKEQKNQKSERKEKQEIILNDDELAVITKLLAFKYEQRLPSFIDKQLTAKEKSILNNLLNKNIIRIYKGGKYSETGVYDIPRGVYIDITRQLRHVAEKEKGKGGGKEELGKESEEEGLTPLEIIEKEGYFVAESEGEARKLSDELKTKKREFRGVRGFDKKYYVVKNSFFSKYSKKIKDILKEGNKTIDQIVNAVNLPKNACVAILTILNEEGDIIEKRKGVFVLAE